MKIAIDKRSGMELMKNFPDEGKETGKQWFNFTYFILVSLLLALNRYLSTGLFKILGWCPGGSVLPHGEKVSF